MIIKRNIKKVLENVRDGNGILIGEYVTDNDLFEDVTMISRMILEPKASIGYHIHSGDGELYYILKGDGVFLEKDKKTKVSSGDFCIINDGEGHGLINYSNNSNLEFMAVVFKKYHLKKLCE
ncbi:cupin domain-containing protein [Peptoniphilus raoultii]|uniref:cupin domain-containing protein n=1 Tax=Peptoniphilus raoultii TaxID=1776387 RepID=UPI0008DA43A8|nr:cupin domain-containing protein [Peptoniphilus raoultii]